MSRSEDVWQDGTPATFVDPRRPNGPIRIGRFLTAETVLLDPHDAYTIHARNGDTIGFVEWYPRWKEYVFQADDQTVLSHQCLRDMAMFLCKAKRWDASEIKRP